MHYYDYFISFFLICMLKYFIKDKEKVNYYFKNILNQNYFASYTIINTNPKNKKIKDKKEKKEKKEKKLPNNENLKKIQVKSSIIIHKKRINIRIL